MPMTLLAALAAVSVGVDVGWQPAEDGGLEYIIQIEPHKVQMLQAGDTISVGIRPELRDVRCYRIVVGDGNLPRSDETLQRSLKAPGDVSATPEIAGPYCPVDQREPNADKSLAGSGNHLREEKSIWSAAPSTGPTDDRPALRPPTLTLSPPASSRDSRWERTESKIGQPESAPALDAGRAAVGRAESDWAQTDTGAAGPDTAESRQLGDRRTPQFDGQTGAAMPREMADNANRLVPLDNDPPAMQPQPAIRPDGQSAAPAIQNRGRYDDVLSGPDADKPAGPADSRYDWPTAQPNPQPAGATSPKIERSPVVAGDMLPGVAPPAAPSTAAGNRGPRLTPTAPSDLQIVSPPARRPVQFSADPDVVPAVGQSRPLAIPPSTGAGNAVVSATKSSLPTAETGQPASTDAAGSKAKTPDAADTESRRWLPLTLCLAALFASLGGNLYLGWMTLDIRRRFQQLAYRARNAGDADPLEDGGRRSATGRSYA